MSMIRYLALASVDVKKGKDLEKKDEELEQAKINSLISDPAFCDTRKG